MTMDPVGLAALTAILAVALLGLWIGTRPPRLAPRPGQGGTSRPGAPMPGSRASGAAGPGGAGSSSLDDATATLLVIAASEAATAPHSPSACDHAAASDSHASMGGHGDFGGYSDAGGYSDSGGCGH